MPTRREVAQALYGAWRLAHLDRQALGYFDLSHDGVWRSFWAAAICYPGFFVLLLLRVDSSTVAQSGFLHILIVETIGYVVAWTAFPLLVLGFCRRIGRFEQGFDFVAAYNWSQVLQTALLVIVALANATVVAEGLAPILDLASYLAILGYEWFIAYLALESRRGVATVIVLIDVALGSILVVISASLY